MNTTKSDLPAGWWAENLEELDREIARLATLCQVRILEPGVIERVLHRDASVCGTSNEIAFAKLHDMVMFHFAVRQKSADAVGQAQTAQDRVLRHREAEEILPGSRGRLAAGVRHAQRRTEEPTMVTESKPNADASLTTLRGTFSRLTSDRI